MTEKIKIAWFADDIDRRAKGTATYSRQLVTELATRFSDQVDLTLIHRNGKCVNPVCRLAKNITIKTFKTPFFQGTFSWFWYFLTGREKFDVFHSPRPNLYPFFFLSKLRGKIKKFVVTLHGAPDKDTPRLYRPGGSWWGWHIKYLAKYFVDMFLGDSQIGQKQIIDYYRINPKKVGYFFLDSADGFRQFSLEEKATAQKRLAERYHIKPPFFLQVGRLDPHKNVHRLIEAFAILKKEHQAPQTLVVIGGRHLKEYTLEVEETIKRLNLEKSVMLAPYIEEADMPALYNLCDLYTYVCVNDGFSLPLVEAMKCGAPIVTSNLSVFPEVAADSAYYVDPFNPQEIAAGIWKVLNDEALKKELVAKGFERAKVFSWQKAAQDLINIYQRILSRRD